MKEYIKQNYGNCGYKIQENLANLFRVSKILILAVDQGMEHGPDRSFAMSTHKWYEDYFNFPDRNPLNAYDPAYHFNLAKAFNLSAFAAPLGMLELCKSNYPNDNVPTILKLNSSNSLLPKGSVPDQAVTASVDDAVRLGCVGIGYTIYPGSSKSLDMIEEFREISKEAKSKGLIVVAWSYPRGESLTKDGETAIDVVSYGAHMACMLGAHIVKVKIPTAHIEQDEAKKIYTDHNIKIDTIEDRIKHVVKCCFNGKRIVIFSGGNTKSTDDELLKEIEAIRNGGGHGSIIGRNIFQHKDPSEIIRKIKDTYRC